MEIQEYLEAEKIDYEISYGPDQTIIKFDFGMFRIEVDLSQIIETEKDERNRLYKFLVEVNTQYYDKLLQREESLLQQYKAAVRTRINYQPAFKMSGIYEENQ